MSDDNNVSFKKQDIHDDNQQEKLVPELRFPEFKDNWKLIRLKNLINNESSKLSINNLEDNYGNYPLYGASGFIKNINFYKKEENYIAIVKDGSGVGNSFIYNGKSSVVGTMQYLNTINNNDLKFAYYLLQTLNLEKYKIGSSIPHIYFKDYSKEKIYLPSINEQKEISNFLSLIDKKIELLEKKYRNQIKFSKELRNKFLNKHCFFNDNWVEHDIKEYVVEYKEKVNFNNNLPILSSTLSGIYLQEDYFNKNVNSSDVSNYKIVPKNYFTYRSMSDTGKFKFNIQNIVEKGIISPAYPVFTTKNINDKYVYEFLNYSNSIKRQILKIKEGGTRYALGFSKFKKLKIEVPSFKTQCKITESMNLCYQREENLKKEIKIMKKFKKGLLQKMFI